MNPRTRKILFTLFAPITVPVYILFLIFTNLLGGAYYIVIESTVAKLFREPIALSKTQFWILAIPILLIAPVALAIHLLIGLARGVLGFLTTIGRWQTGGSGTWQMASVGAVWVIVAIWVTLTCLDAELGTRLIGQKISQTDRDAFVEFNLRYRTLANLTPEMNARRATLLEALSDAGYNDAWIQKKESEIRNEYEQDAKLIDRPNRNIDEERLMLQAIVELKTDDTSFKWLPAPFQRWIANVPWYFKPAEFSDAEDGQDRSTFLPGPLLFCWLLLIRWPGTFVVVRPRWFRFGWFVVRAAVVTWAIFSLVTWRPITFFESFYFGATSNGQFARFVDPPIWFQILSPAVWGNPNVDLGDWVRPHWILTNIAIWLVLIGAATFLFWVAARLAPFVSTPRYYIAFLASRLLQRKRIAFFSVGAVTLCVAMMIIVKSVMGGFVDSIKERAHGLLGDVVVGGDLPGFPYYEEFIEEVKKLRDPKTDKPLVLEATPLIYTYGLIQFPFTKETKAVEIRGVRLDEYRKVNEFGKDLFYDKRFGDTRLDIARGKPVYGVGPDDKIQLPDDMDRHYFEKYLPSLSDEKREEETKRFKREKNDFEYRGPGVFSMTEDTALKPGYEGKEFPGVIIGRDMILRRMASGEYHRTDRYPRGDPCFLTLLPLTRGGDVLNEPPPKPLFRYVDDSRTGIHDIDKKTVYIDFAIAQNLLKMGAEERVDGGMSSPRANQVLIKFHDEFAEPRDRLNASVRLIDQVWMDVINRVPADELETKLLRYVEIDTWESLQRTYIAAIQKEEGLVLIMFGVISIVAIFLILCIFYMIVQEKTRDVGILKSVGGSAEGITAIFLVYGAAIGLVGSIFGSILGTNFVTHINDVQSFIAQIDPALRVWSPETYSFDQIPSVWKWFDVWRICLGAIIASVIGAAVPAIRAGKTWPVESLRYE